MILLLVAVACLWAGISESQKDTVTCLAFLALGTILILLWSYIAWR